ncbi:MAG: hypothetical protein ABIJ34_08390 [archaeon]
MADLETDKLRSEIDRLKKKNEPEGSTEDLTRAINSLIKIFAEASEDLKIDTHDAVLVGQKLDGIMDRLEKIEIQNEKIAKGIVAVADMVEEYSAGRVSMPRDARQMKRSTSQPSQMNSMPKPLPSYDMPREDEKKKGMFNFKI